MVAMGVDVRAATLDFVAETTRLRLRRFRRDDVDAVFAIIGDPVTMQYYPRQFGLRDAAEWVERNLRRYDEHGHGLFAVTLRNCEEVIGDCGLIAQVVDGQPELEVGYHFRRDQWGHGYASEAARACMDLAFRECAAGKVISLIRPENVPSRRVAERNGMKVERQVVHAKLPHVVYAVTREEFQRVSKQSASHPFAK
jgi:RimJ/RimL family protein N-acetyltransferase